MSASLCRRLTRTWPLPARGRARAGAAALAPALGARRSTCTWRSVTGSIASAFLSTMPNGAAANLAIGGALPVCTLSGKLDALASGRPALSRSVAGISMLNAAFSASGFGNAISLTSVALSSLSNTGASGAPAAGRRRTWAASSRATGAREANAHRPDRQARRVGALALAAEVGREGGADGEGKALLDRGDDLRVARRGDALAPDEPQGGAVRQRPLAAREQRPLGPRLVDAARLQHLRAHVAADDPEREPLADALDLAPGVGERRCRRPPGRSGAAGSAGPPRSRCRRPAASRRRPGRRSRTRSASLRSAPARWRRSRQGSRRRPSLPASSRRGPSRCSCVPGPSGSRKS